jgi:hypothetical protein
MDTGRSKKRSKKQPPAKERERKEAAAVVVVVAEKKSKKKKKKVKKRPVEEEQADFDNQLEYVNLKRQAMDGGEEEEDEQQQQEQGMKKVSSYGSFLKSGAKAPGAGRYESILAGISLFFFFLLKKNRSHVWRRQRGVDQCSGAFQHAPSRSQRGRTSRPGCCQVC